VYADRKFYAATALVAGVSADGHRLFRVHERITRAV
jgi:hypothetical protein